MENKTDEPNHIIKSVIEALLFTNEKPVMIDQMKKAFHTVDVGEIKKAIQELQQEYEESQRGMSIVEIADGYQMLSNRHYASYIRDFYKTKHKEKLSKPALETVAIIAYKQPVTRSDIELIRGVNSDGVVMHLLSKELIKVVGRKDVAGRPYLYGTTKQFLEYFGLKSLEDLPKLEELKEFEKLQEDKEEPSEPIEEGEETVATTDSPDNVQQQEPKQTTEALAPEATTSTATAEVPAGKTEEETEDEPKESA